MMMTRPAVFTMLPWGFHFRVVLLINPCFSRSSQKGVMMCVEAETCIKSDSVKNKLRTGLFTDTLPFIQGKPLKGTR